MSALTPGGSTRRWRRLRAFVLERDAFRCRVVEGCSNRATHVDHILPRSKGGTDHASNLRAACARHNLERGAGAPVRAARPTPTRRWSW